MLDHVGGGTVGERLTGLSSVIRDILVDEVDVARRREGIRVLLPVRIVQRLGYLAVRRHAILEIVPPMLDTVVLQGAVATAGVIGRAGFLAVASVGILQSGISRMVAVASRFLNVHLLASFAVIVICRRIWHRLRTNVIIRMASFSI